MRLNVVVLPPAAYGVVVALLLGCATKAIRQTESACRPPDGISDRLVGYMKRLGTERVNPEVIAVRNNSGLPAVSESEVVLVTDQAVCRAARHAWHAQFARWNPTFAPELLPNPQRVTVVRVGTVYAVHDPDWLGGEWGMIMYFDRQWRFLNSSTR